MTFETLAKKIFATKNHEVSLWDLVHKSKTMNDFIPASDRKFWITMIEGVTDGAKLQELCDVFYEEHEKNEAIREKYLEKTAKIVSDAVEEGKVYLKVETKKAIAKAETSQNKVDEVEMESLLKNN